MGSFSLKKAALYSVFICLSAGLLMACEKPRVHGNIFLDENGNDKYDVGEKLLGNVLYEVSFGNTPLTTGISDVDGFYEFEVKNKGRYCVKVESMETQTPVVSIPGQQLGKMGVGAKAIIKGEKDDLANPDDDKDNILDDGDKSGTVGDNKCAGGATVNCDDNCLKKPNASQADEDEDGVGDACDNCPNDKNADQKDTDGDDIGNVCDKEKEGEDESKEESKYEPPSADGETRSSCITKEMDSKVAVMDVPVAKQFESSVAQIPEQTYEAMAGGEVEVAFIFPCSCRLTKPIYLPSGLVWSTGEMVVDVSGNQDIDSFITTVPSVMHDKLCKKIFTVSTKPISAEEASYTLETVATCPDEKKIPLRRIVKVYGRSPIEVSSASLITDVGELKPNNDISIRYGLKNISDEDYEYVVFTIGISSLTADVPSLMVKEANIEAANIDCDKQGGSAVCKFPLDSGRTKILKFIFQGPTNANAGEFKTEASIKINDLIPPLEEMVDETVRFTVPEEEE